MLPSFTYLLFFWFLGELLKYIFNIPLSGSIVGMLLLFCALQFKIVKIESVNRSSEFLLKHLNPLFYTIWSWNYGFYSQNQTIYTSTNDWDYC